MNKKTPDSLLELHKRQDLPCGAALPLRDPLSQVGMVPLEAAVAQGLAFSGGHQLP